MFERLTRWENNDKDVADLIEEKLDFNGLTEAINRLAAYEDSGLSPEEVLELKEKYETEKTNSEAAYTIMCGLTEEVERLKEKLKAVLQDFYQYVQGGKEICAFCLHDYECEPGETICGATYKGFRWRGLNERG